MKIQKDVIIFVLKFLSLFCFFYFGTIIMIGLAAPGKLYFPFVEKYLDYITWLRTSLLVGIKFLVGAMGYQTTIEPGFLIRITHQRGVIIAYDCAGYGVMSFWMAYVIAEKNKIKALLKKLLIGLLVLWLINVIRISLFLISINQNWYFPFHLDHHTVFNILSYLAIGFMIWAFEKKSNQNLKEVNNQSDKNEN